MAPIAPTMRAVVFHGPGKVAVEQRPVPKIQEPTDIVVRVDFTALCGSELHVFRAHQPSPTGFIMGHEFTGEVVQAGSKVVTVKEGDAIVSPFTVSCGQCFYCRKGFSSRCEKCLLFGTAALDGAQAEYVRVPLADSTVMKAPEGIDKKALVLMADIFPTGYFAAANAFAGMSKEDVAEATVVVVGCGPVGLCALINAEEFKPKHLFAVDSIDSRLELAKELGAEPLNFKTDREGLERRIKEVTDGRGADVVIEVVGLSPALKLAFDILRPWGFISSVGVHNGEIPWGGNQAYGKNLRIQMGRCPVRSIFPQALAALKAKQHLLGFMADAIMPLSKAVEGYEVFDKMKAQKVVFEGQK
ncbi:chaperonin 10-like protein [Phyllosticta citribraziliensis]|uniref:Chaperonin 10-like protein n=1 Tax=Phyllosticta citribraziliensis TaxID=989973 RepID=A0ABR1L9Y4_9PEZI